jgi:hypothetical protein
MCVGVAICTFDVLQSPCDIETRTASMWICHGLREESRVLFFSFFELFHRHCIVPSCLASLSLFLSANKAFDTTRSAWPSTLAK